MTLQNSVQHCVERLERDCRERSAIAAKLLAAAIARELDDLPFVVESSDAYRPCIAWDVAGETLQQFGDRVRKVRERVGPPTRVAPARWASPHDRAPDLNATWELEHEGMKWYCTVGVATPVGCRIDPRVVPATGVPTVYAELHPECAAALKELEE